MRNRVLPLSFVLAMLPSLALAADFLPAGIYDCTIQPQGTMKLQPMGILEITPEGFSGPQEEGAETDLYVYLLNPDGTVNWPNEFAKNVEGGVEVVEATYYDFAAAVLTRIKMADGTIASVSCQQRQL